MSRESLASFCVSTQVVSGSILVTAAAVRNLIPAAAPRTPHSGDALQKCLSIPGHGRDKEFLLPLSLKPAMLDQLLVTTQSQLEQTKGQVNIEICVLNSIATEAGCSQLHCWLQVFTNFSSINSLNELNILLLAPP